jgi:hypothetical protein
MQDDQTEKIKDKASAKMGETATDLNAYATIHPLRMWTGAFLVGLGTGMVASRMHKEKSGFQKFVDQLRD